MGGAPPAPGRDPARGAVEGQRPTWLGGAGDTRPLRHRWREGRRPGL